MSTYGSGPYGSGPYGIALMVQVDWAADGTWTTAGDDITARVLTPRGQVSTQRGRDNARLLSRVSLGEASFLINNSSGDYDPENGSSPLAANLLPGRPVRILAALGGITHTLFQGYLDDFTLAVDANDQSASLTCVDVLGRLRGVTVSTGLMAGVRTGDAITAVLDAAGWSADLRDIDPGVSFLPWFWASSEDAYDVIVALLDSEGPPALICSGPNGELVFRDRHHRLLSSASTTSQATWNDSGTAPLILADGYVYDHGWRDIVNSLTFDVPLRRLAGELSVVWTSDGTHTISDGETLPLTISGAPFTGAEVPTDGIDFTTVSGAVTVVLSRTSGASTTIYLTATGGPAIITNLQLRAYTLETFATVQVSAEEPVSIGRYGRRSPTEVRSPSWTNPRDAQAIAELYVGQGSERTPTVVARIKGDVTANLTQQLGRELSDRVHLNAGNLHADMFIERIAHDIEGGNALHATTFHMRKCPDLIANVFTFDDATRGFNDGLFGQMGQSQPGTMFIFDSATQGFNDGVFAY